MSLSDRLARIRERPTRPSFVWTERTARDVSETQVVDLASVKDRLARRARPTAPPDVQRIVFVDFCPGGLVIKRLDVAWLQQGICTFDHFSSEEQWETFQSIVVGDLIVMKRDLATSQTTRLYAHGRVVAWELDEKRDRVLLVNWSHERGQIEVPRIRCNNMVKIQDIDEAEAVMPTQFWEWLAG
jgi:hypothetical protein